MMACSTMRGVVRERSAHELDCPEDEIDVESIGGTSYRAEGCGSTATYTCIGSVCVRDDPPGEARNEPDPVATPKPGDSQETASRTPASDPPPGAGGFEFGAARKVAQAACVEEGYEWKALGKGTYTCSGVVKGVDLADASTELSFCRATLCRIVITGKAPEGSGWMTTAVGLLKVLVAKYGEAAERDVRIPQSCVKERGSPDCIERGDASLRVLWTWPTAQRIELFAGIPDGSQGPAIQIAYTSPSSAPRAEGL
jgi:hypothetical protein